MTLREKAYRFVDSLMRTRNRRAFDSHDMEFAYRVGYDQALKDTSEAMYWQLREKLIVDE